MTIKQQGGIFGRNPTFNEVDVQTNVSFSDNAKALFGNSSDLAVYHNGSNSIIEDTGSGNLYIQGTHVYIKDASGNNFARFYDNGTGGQIRLYHDASKVFETNSSGISITGNVAVTSGNGIDFSATSDASGSSSELFDDYEEGTWTPTLTTDGTDFDDVDYNGNRSGYYRKIGSAVFITGYMRTNSTTVGSASGNVLIGGLPYTSSSTNRSAMSVTAAENWAGEEPLSLALFGNSTSMGVRYRAGVTTTDLETQVSDVGTNNILAFSGIYFT